MEMAAKDYHHGNLRNALIDAAVAEIADVGLSAMSLRKVAARVGVTHPAASHHFGDKTGLLTALAAEGYRSLADALRSAHGEGGDLLDLGVAYLRFAHDHRPLFEVMFRPELLQTDDAELVAAQAASGGELRGASGSRAGARQQQVARGRVVVRARLRHVVARREPRRADASGGDRRVPAARSYLHPGGPRAPLTPGRGGGEPRRRVPPCLRPLPTS